MQRLNHNRETDENERGFRTGGGGIPVGDWKRYRPYCYSTGVKSNGNQHMANPFFNHRYTSNRGFGYSGGGNNGYRQNRDNNDQNRGGANLRNQNRNGENVDGENNDNANNAGENHDENNGGVENAEVDHPENGIRNDDNGNGGGGGRGGRGGGIARGGGQGRGAGTGRGGGIGRGGSRRYLNPPAPHTSWKHLENIYPYDKLFYDMTHFEVNYTKLLEKYETSQRLIEELLEDKKKSEAIYLHKLDKVKMELEVTKKVYKDMKP